MSVQWLASALWVKVHWRARSLLCAFQSGLETQAPPLSQTDLEPKLLDMGLPFSPSPKVTHQHQRPQSSGDWLPLSLEAAAVTGFSSTV